MEVSNEPTAGSKTEFSSKALQIYVRWEGHDLPEGAKVRLAWVAEDVGGIVEPNFVIDETETVAPESFWFRVSRVFQWMDSCGGS